MIRIIITGGTIDKQYNELSGELCFPATHVPGMLEQGRCTVPVVIEQLMQKDSLDMSGQDRVIVAQACITAAEQQIVITHGTDTLVETAAVIADKVNDKTIVLTGAMVPYAVGNSDALFNIGSAISAVQLLPPEVYVAMNGQIFNWDNVQKLKQQGKFQVLRKT